MIGSNAESSRDHPDRSTRAISPADQLRRSNRAIIRMQ
jgi:hypothetical protein